MHEPLQLREKLLQGRHRACTRTLPTRTFLLSCPHHVSRGDDPRTSSIVTNSAASSPEGRALVHEMSSAQSELADPPTDGISAVKFAPEHNLLLVREGGRSERGRGREGRRLDGGGNQEGDGLAVFA